MLLGGLRADDYTVTIGLAVCQKTVVHLNLIVCEPPKNRPPIATDDSVHPSKIPVKVRIL